MIYQSEHFFILFVHFSELFSLSQLEHEDNDPDGDKPSAGIEFHFKWNLNVDIWKFEQQVFPFSSAK